MENKITAIIFDIGGVIVTEEGPKIALELTRKIGVSTDELEESRTPDFEKTFRGDITMLKTYTNAISRLKKDIAPEDLLDLHLELYEKITSKPIIDLTFLNKLKDNYKIACLTNMEHEIADLNKNRNFFAVFEPHVFISSKMGLMKPNPEIFQIVLENLQSDPSETIYVDDNSDYVEVARRMGIKSILFENFEKLKNDLKNWESNYLNNS